MNAPAAGPSSPLLTAMLLLAPVGLLLLFLWRLGRKGQGNIDLAVRLSEEQLAAQRETNRLLERLIAIHEDRR